MFDAMFDRQKGSTPSFDVLRQFALHAPLTRETIELARVVARRWVVIKAATFGVSSSGWGCKRLLAPALGRWSGRGCRPCLDLRRRSVQRPTG